MILDNRLTIDRTDNQDVTGVTEKLKLYKVPINRKPGVPPLTTLKTLLPSLEESKLLAMDEAALLAALGISTVEKVAKTCYIGPPIVETNTTTTNTTASDEEVVTSPEHFLKQFSHYKRLRQPQEGGDRLKMTCWRLIGQITRCCPMIG